MNNAVVPLPAQTFEFALIVLLERIFVHVLFLLLP